MEKLKAKFIKGVIGDDYGLSNDLPHVSFFGRSNAGKSSVINSLIDKNIVKTSKNPGQTTEANFFLINNSFYFVDFPGYGYAKRSIKDRDKMIKRIFWYVEKSITRPKAVFLIVDVKVGLKSLDREMISVLKDNNHNIVIIANKIDKIKKNELESQLLKIKEESNVSSIIPYSAKKEEGREILTKKILDLVEHN